MRVSALAAAMAVLLCAAPAEARLFYKTYGATAPTADGGCVWNVNQDYFVPRHCHTGRYGLWSACKTSRTTSPACRRCHPLYPGYCSPYGALHYRWRDCLYKCRCGCTPLACYYGPWKREYCGCCKPPLMRLHDPCCRKSIGCGGKCGRCQTACCRGPACGSCGLCAPEIDYFAHGPIGGPIPNVEGYELEIIGTIAADSSALLLEQSLDEAARAASELQGQEPRVQWLPSFGVPQNKEVKLSP